MHCEICLFKKVPFDTYQSFNIWRLYVDQDCFREKLYHFFGLKKRFSFTQTNQHPKSIFILNEICRRCFTDDILKAIND